MPHTKTHYEAKIGGQIYDVISETELSPEEVEREAKVMIATEAEAATPGMALRKTAVPESYLERVQRRLGESGQSFVNIPSNVGKLVTGRGGIAEALDIGAGLAAPTAPITAPVEAAIEHPLETFGVEKETARTLGSIIGGAGTSLGLGLAAKGKSLTQAGEALAQLLGVGRPVIGRHEAETLRFVRERPRQTLEDLEQVGKEIGGTTAEFVLNRKAQEYAEALGFARKFGIALEKIPTPNLVIDNIDFTPRKHGIFRGLGTPTTQMALENPLAAKAQFEISLTEARTRSAIEALNAEDRAHYINLSPEAQREIFQAMEGRFTGPPRPGALDAASYTRAKLDKDRARIISTLRRDIRPSVERELQKAFDRAEEIAGQPLSESQRAARIDAKIKEKVPDDWGLEDYLPHIFPGNYLIYADGKLVGSASTKLEAKARIYDLVTSGFKSKEITVEAKSYFDPEVLAGFRARTRRTIDSIAKGAGLTRDEIEKAGMGNFGGRAKSVWWGPLKERLGAKGFSEELQDVMSIYNRGLERWIQHSQLSRRVAPVMQELAGRGYNSIVHDLRSSMDRLWGYRSPSSYLFDATLESIPVVEKFVAPYALERWTGALKGGMANLYLKYNPRFHGLNALQTLATLWPIADTADLAMGFKLYFSKEGKDLLKRYAITGGRIEEFGKKIGMEENVNQGVAFLTMFRRGLKLGLSPDQAADYAIIRGNFYSQFMGLTTDIPLAFRTMDPHGVFTMFQRFPVKQTELVMGLIADKNYPGAAKWLAVNFLLGGRKGLTVGAGGYLGYQQYQEIKQKYGEAVADFFHVGLPAFIGLDMSNSTSLWNIPFGNSIPERLGNQLLGVIGSTAMTTINAASNQKTLEPAMAKRIYDANMERLPIGRELTALAKLITGDYDIHTPAGKLKYKAGTRDLIIRFLGGRPLAKVEQPRIDPVTGQVTSVPLGPLDLFVDAFYDVRVRRDAVLDYAVSLVGKPALAGLSPSEEVLKVVRKDVDAWNNMMWPAFQITSDDIVTRAKERIANFKSPEAARVAEAFGRRMKLGIMSQGLPPPQGREP